LKPRPKGRGICDLFKKKALVLLEDGIQVDGITSAAQDTENWERIFFRKPWLVDLIYARSSLHMSDDELQKFMRRVLLKAKKGSHICIEGKNQDDPKIQRSKPLQNGLYIDHTENEHARRVWNSDFIQELCQKFGLTLISIDSHCDDFGSFTNFIAQKQ
jgi:hypothetical protein